MVNLVGKVLCFTDYGRKISVSFALVVRQTPKCVFLKTLPKIESFEDPLRYAGTTVPDLSKINEYMDLPTKDLQRGTIYWKEMGQLEYVGQGDSAFHLWDGKPMGFDHKD